MIKKYINYVLLVFLLFIPCCLVNADDGDFSSFYVGYNNTCSSLRNNDVEGACDGSSISDGHFDGNSLIADELSSNQLTGDVYISNVKTTVVTNEDCGDANKISYSVVLLLDHSNSISSPDAKKVRAAAYDLLQKLKEKNNKIKDKNGKVVGNYKLNVCSFDDKVKCSGFKSVSSMKSVKYEDPGGGGWTDIQKALNTAYSSLKNSGGQAKNAPMVILVTDGYPTVAHTGVNSKKYTGGTTLKEGASARYAYYTAKSFMVLKKDMINLQNFGYRSSAKLISLGVGLYANDEYGKFILNPNRTNYNNLNKDDSKLHSTESKTLYNLMNGNQVNEIILRGIPNPEKGVFRGTRIKEKSGYYYQFKNVNVDNIKHNTGYKIFCGSNWTSCSGSIKKTTKCSCKSKPTSYGGKGKFTYVESHIDDKSVDYSAINDLSGLSTALVQSIDGVIPDSCKTVQNTSTNVSTPIKETKTYNEYNHTGSCSSNNYSLNNGETVYYKIPNSITLGSTELKDLRIYEPDVSAVNYKDVFSDNSYKTCVGVKVSFDSVITEDSRLSLGNLGNVSYAGSGFSMEGANLENSISWYYGSIDSSGQPLVNVSFLKPGYIRIGKDNDNYSYFSDSSGVPKKINALSNIPYNDLYSDYGCNNKLYDNIDSFNREVWNKIKNNINSDSEISGKISSNVLKSIDSNDANNGNVSVGVDVSSNVDNDDLISPNFINNNKVAISNNKKLNQLSYKYNFVFNRGCISVIEKGNIRYLDNSSSNCASILGDNYINGTNEKGLNQWFVPINYIEKIVYLDATGNLSNVKDIEVNYKLSCPTNVKGGVYDCPEGADDSSKCKLKYHYRSVNVNKPFPKAGTKDKVALNWRDWYCGDDTSCTSSNFNKVRLNNTYSSSSKYVINISKDSVINSGDVSISTINSINSLYTDWSGMSLDGTSAFVNNYFSSYLTANNGYCKLGMLNDNCE